MADPIKISELSNVGVPDTTGILPLVQNNDGTLMTWNVSLAQVAEFVIKNVTFEELPTEAKTIFGAIEEIHAIITTQEGA